LCPFRCVNGAVWRSSQAAFPVEFKEFMFATAFPQSLEDKDQ
jgi:hypothetical protein